MSSQELVETTRITLVSQPNETKLHNSVETVIETTQDFTDSAYTTHENRERIITVCEKVKSELVSLVEVGKILVSTENVELTSKFSVGR